MKVGLVHGRFQPFHDGHEYLVKKMLSFCDVGVVLIGSYGCSNKRNPYSFDQRKKMILERDLGVYGFNLIVGGNMDSKLGEWDILLSSCVLSLTGKIPTHIFCGPDYSIKWNYVNPVIFKEKKRYKDISSTKIRNGLI